MKKNKIPVIMGALVQRINRKIAHDGKKLHSLRKRVAVFDFVCFASAMRRGALEKTAEPTLAPTAS